MTKSEMLDNLDGVLSDISHLLDMVPADEERMMLIGMKRTLARVADALQFSEVNENVK